MIRAVEQLQAVFEAEIRASLRQAGPFIFLVFFPFLLSGVTYGAGSVISGGRAGPEQWFYQLIGYSVLMVSIVMAESGLWYVRQGLLTGRLEYALAAPVNPLVVVAASSLSRVIYLLATFLAVGLLGVAVVYGIGMALGVLFSLVLLFAAVMPVLGINMALAALTMILKEPEPISSAFNSVVSATAGFTYPISLLPPILQLLSRALPHSYLVDLTRNAIFLRISFADVNAIPLLIAYFVGGLIVYRLMENHFIRRAGAYGW